MPLPLPLPLLQVPPQPIPQQALPLQELLLQAVLLVVLVQPPTPSVPSPVALPGRAWLATIVCDMGKVIVMRLPSSEACSLKCALSLQFCSAFSSRNSSPLSVFFLLFMPILAGFLVGFYPLLCHSLTHFGQFLFILQIWINVKSNL